jgi:hypothetical protein
MTAGAYSRTSPQWGPTVRNDFLDTWARPAVAISVPIDATTELTGAVTAFAKCPQAEP